jgi:molybdopterin molybdotransferase
METEKSIQGVDLKKQSSEILAPLLQHVPKATCVIDEVPIEEAVGQTLFEPVFAVRDDPPYSKALSDGYILLSSETAMASPRIPRTFEVLGDMPPSSNPAELPPGKSLRVKNGNYMSIKRFMEGYYAIVKESNASEKGGKVSVTHSVIRHENIAIQGSINRKGSVLFDMGHRLQPDDLFTLAIQGIMKVKVAHSPTVVPRVAIFSIGNDIIPLKELYKVGFKYDCNSYGLAALVRDRGGIPTSYGVVPDLTPTLIKTLSVSLPENDLILFSAEMTNKRKKLIVDAIKEFASMGLTDPDQIQKVLEETCIIEDQAKPHILAVLNKKPVICLDERADLIKQGFQHFVEPIMVRQRIGL